MKLSALLCASLLLAPSAAAQCGIEYSSSSGPGDAYGSSIDARGDWVAVGAPSGGPSTAGAVYLYERVAGALVLRQTMTPPSGGGGGSDFGRSVALDGSRLAVGAPGSGGAGRVFIYELLGGSWTYSGEAGPAAVPSGARYGASVALSGDVLVVGAPDASNNRGRVWILRHVGGQWTDEASLLAPIDWDNGHMGLEVGIAGSRAVVAAPFADGAAGFQIGRVGVYDFDGVSWNATGDLTPNDHHHYDRIGWGGVDVLGDLVVIGCPNASGIVGAGYTSLGYVYVFEKVGTGWDQVQKLGASDPDHGSWFGGAIDIDGSTLLVGAHRDTRDVLLTGAGYLFDLQGNQWVEREKLLSPTPFIGDHLGHEVALTPGHALLGAGLEVEPGYPVRPSRVLDFDQSALPPQVAEPFCFGTDCACHPRLSLLGGCRNSLYQAGELRACGSASVSLDDLVLTADRLLPGQFGLIFMGGGELDQLFGDGRLCVGSGGAGVYRFPARAIGAAGCFEESNLALYSQQNFGAGAILPGSTWYYQAWYRDPVGVPCFADHGSGWVKKVPTVRGYNLTSALKVIWQP